MRKMCFMMPLFCFAKESCGYGIKEKLLTTNKTKKEKTMDKGSIAMG